MFRLHYARPGRRKTRRRTHNTTFKERRIMKTRILAIAALGLAFALTGCKSNPDPAALQAENDSLRQQLDNSNTALETA